MRTGVLGGTFDPPHMGHLVLGEQARAQLGLGRVLWVPAGEPWRKPHPPVTPAEHRAAMTSAAIVDNEAFELCRLELERPGPSYSVDTLEELRARHPDDELVFIIGKDALDDLPNWRRPERLVELATLAVAVRAGDEARVAPAGLDARVEWVDMPRLDISASDLRARAAGGLSLRYLVPPSVEAYIRDHGLYRR
jgi:nicotinate-nucleotide adenylyltransferase